MMELAERETLARKAFEGGPIEVPAGFWSNPPSDLPHAESYRIQIYEGVFCDTPNWIVEMAADPVAFLAEEIRGVLMGLEAG